MKLELTRPAVGALLALALTCGDAAAAKLQGETWCRAEPGWSSAARQKLDLQALLGRHGQEPRHLAASRPAAKAAVGLRPAPVVHPRPAPVGRAPAKEIEVASCSGGYASILCPGYQLIGFQY